MSQQDSWSTVLWGALVAFFVAVGYFSWQFVSNMKHGAESAQEKVQATDISNINSFTLSQASDDSIVTPDWQAHEVISSGSDLAVQQGEFSYRNGQPFVRLALYNQGGFSVTGAMINLALFLDGSDEAVAESVALPVPFNGAILTVGERMIVDIPVSGDAWTDEQVRLAQSRMVLAKVVSVSDGDRDNVDYPQTDAGVYLKQVVNDWGEIRAASESFDDMDMQEGGDMGFGDLPELAVSVPRLPSAALPHDKVLSSDVDSISDEMSEHQK